MGCGCLRFRSRFIGTKGVFCKRLIINSIMPIVHRQNIIGLSTKVLKRYRPNDRGRWRESYRRTAQDIRLIAHDRQPDNLAEIGIDGRLKTNRPATRP